tara:strand:- start:67 stop:2067 length:2001 start_codon:yes stop_codon:yes gene_type:complete
MIDTCVHYDNLFNIENTTGRSTMLLYKRMYKILENEFGKLPKSGVLAGQAVAEAFFRAENINIKSRMKDLDWFVNSTERPDEVIGCFSANLTPEVNIVIPSYDADLRVGGIIKHGLYTVVTSDIVNDGRINRVLIKNPSAVVPVTPMEVLNGFDINCTACALDLDTKKVIRHHAFDDFCQSREIDFISLHTPLSSLVRVFEKKEYIDGTSINMDKLVEVVRCAVWSRYCDDYTNFVESKSVAPQCYKKGTGMTFERFASLGQPIKDMLDEHFNIHEISLFDGGNLYAFTPKEEPKKISALARVLGADVNVASYSVELMSNIALMPTEAFYDGIISPLKACDTVMYNHEDTRLIRGFLQGALLKGFYSSNATVSFKDIAGMFQRDLICDRASNLSGNKDHSILFSDLICRLLENYIDSDNTIDETSSAIVAVCNSFRTIGDSMDDLSVFINLPWTQRTALVDSLIIQARKGECLGECLSTLLDKPILPLIDTSRMQFGVSAEHEGELRLQYTVQLAACLKDVVGNNKDGLGLVTSSLDATLLLVEFKHEGVCSNFIAEVYWSEHEAQYKLPLRHYINQDKIPDETIINSIKLHIQSIINKETRYSVKRLKALLPMVGKKLVDLRSDIKEMFTQDNAHRVASMKFRGELHSLNDPNQINVKFDSDIPF